MEFEPAARDGVENVAWPVAVTCTVANTVEPFLKAMVPVGTPAPGVTTLTVPVNVTEPLRRDGFADELTVVVVEAALTVCVNVPTLARNVLSPL